MNSKVTLFLFICAALSLSSCVSKKQYDSLRMELDTANKDLGKCGQDLNSYIQQLAACEQDKEKLRSDLRNANGTLQLREEQITDLRDQVQDFKTQRDKQLEAVEGLTQLSQTANENITETLAQLETKDKYIQLLQAAKNRTDSINLALAVNLKGVLSEGIEDNDVEVKVDKTVVFVNLSDKMLYKSGSANLTSRASEVLGKIAKIIDSRPELEVMIEGYTDNQPIKTSCLKDNWDLSVKRATSVVRELQNSYNIDPNRLIAAGRGEFNALESNDTAEGRAINRRTRIIIMPKLDQFYDLLNPNEAPK